MMPRGVVVVLLSVYTAYALAAAASFATPVDRWLRRQRVGLWSLRSALPFWGLFAQRSGMFDLDVHWASDADPARWRAMTGNRWRCWSCLWRPEQRADQVGQIVAYRLLGAAHAAPGELTVQPAYRRAITAAARSSAGAGTVRFRVVLSRGWWTTEAPRTVLGSAWEPAAPRSEGATQ